MTHRKRLALIVLIPALILGAFVGAYFTTTSASVTAGPVIIGDPEGAQSRAIFADNNRVVRIEYFASGAKTMVGANTPVASNAFCGLNGNLHKAEVQFVGTMSGTAPTLAVKWQNSIDGVNWTDVGTWTTINATVTPATQSQTVGDISNAATSVAYGDCWRATYVFGGSGTVTADFSIKGIEK